MTKAQIYYVQDMSTVEIAALDKENILNGNYDFSKPTYYQIMSNDPVFKLINENAKTFDRQKESKQNAWLKSKGYD